MLIPLRDVSRPLSRFPIALATIIAVNVVVFVVELILGDPFIQRYSLTPATVLRGQELETLFTSMFLHADVLHIAGNMVFLWVYGDELEANYLGPIRFIVFYFICGLAADGLQIAVDPTSTIPNLGASGAIAGVLAGFVVLFPRDQIQTFIFSGFGIGQSRISAFVLIGFWILTQVISGVGSVTAIDQGGVAYFAHIGGFASGLVLIKPFGVGRRITEEKEYS
jgi:membrane associated rhomboid family serine protease